MSEQALLRMRAVIETTQLSRSTIYGMIADGRFPKPIKVSRRAVRWRADDIAVWVDSFGETHRFAPSNKEAS